MHTLPLLLSVVLLFSLPASSQWLEFNAGCPEGSEPLVIHNGTWDSFLTYDVELRGLLAETVTVASQAYLRFPSSPGTVPSDSVGWPELPVVRRMVWLPDDSDITLECSANCCEGIECLPVYPVPLDSLVSDSTCTPYIGECFRKDSSAYASTGWYPDTLARLVGEFRLRDLRVGIVDVYPVQYLASEDSLCVWSDIEVALAYDTTADWPTCGLGSYDGIVRDCLVGYRPSGEPWAPVPGSVERPDDLLEGPENVPDYVILVASGLDGWWVDSLAWHRRNLNGFDVAIVRTDSVLSQFGGSALAITSDIIRDFTEAMWDWGSPETKRPSYLLLVGDHEDPDYSGEDWFLPTAVFEPDTADRGLDFGNDSWFVYFDEPRSDSLSVGDMMVGRLPAREPSNLRDMISTIRSYEAVSTFPAPDSLSWRRYITRLQGCPPIESADWQPSAAWTDSIRAWCSYSWDNVYCGDCAAGDAGDHSTMTSDDWDTCLSTYLTRGQQIAFYTDHGIPHCFSAGMDYHSSPPMPAHFGLPDSTFNCWDVDSLPLGALHHGHPFLICLCCGVGTFDHTVAQHYDDSDPIYCFNDDPNTPPLFDFPDDCLAERFVKNTSGGAIGVFASSGASATGAQYSAIGKGLIDAMLCRGISRVGDAIASMRIESYSTLLANSGLGRYNLLGDPAVDIGDRVKFRTRCDLVISPLDLETNRYPTHKVLTSAPAMLRVRVRNVGAVASGSFDVELAVEFGNYDTLLTSVCAGLDPGEESVVSFRWLKPSALYPPFTLALTAEADPEHETPDSWFGNNRGSSTMEVLDMYPNEDGWPILMPGSVCSVPALCDVDGDDSLEIVVQAGRSFLVCAEPEGGIRWISGPFDLTAGMADLSICCEPALGSVCGDASPEVVFFTWSGAFVLSGSTGEVLYSREHGDGSSSLLSVGPRSVVLADLVRETGQEVQRNEIAYVARDTLYVLRVQNGGLVALDREYTPEAFGEGTTLAAAWCVACDLDDDFPDEILVDCAWNTMMGAEKETSLLVYSYPNGRVVDSETWEDVLDWGMPAVGELAGQGLVIAQPRGVADESNAPAYVLDTSLALVDSCEKDAYRNSSHVRVCGMVDWISGSPGLDRITAAPENIAYSWDVDGYMVTHPNYPWTTGGMPPFFALGDLDGDEVPDLLVGRREGWVDAYDSEGYPLGDFDFPFTLPAGLYGGFAIADIDGDEKVEVVFGTSDNYLHVWELADCDEGYEPWPQCQQNAARTGILE